MCLIIKKNAKVETSSKSIVVFKCLTLDGKAPYRKTTYRRGELKEVPYFTGRGTKFTKILPVGTQDVFAGLHVFATKRSAQRFRSTGLVVECRIPRNTPFIRGMGNQIVTLKLKIGKAIGRDDYRCRWQVEGKEDIFPVRKFNQGKRK